MWRSTFVPETIFGRPIRLKQTDRTCWTIQTHSDELNWARRRTFHELSKFGSSHDKFDVLPRPYYTPYPANLFFVFFLFFFFEVEDFYCNFLNNQ